MLLHGNGRMFAARSVRCQFSQIALFLARFRTLIRSATAASCYTSSRRTAAQSLRISVLGGHVYATFYLQSSSGVIAMSRDVERSGKVGYVIMWLLGVPIPILLIIFLLRGCT